jgi:hypothetical protein
MCNRKCEKSLTTITIGLYLADLAQFDRASECPNLNPTSRSSNSALILKEQHKA